MANDRTWAQVVSVVVDDYSTTTLLTKSIAWQRFRLLQLAGWTIAGTCDSVTAGMDGPGTNRMGTSWDASKWVWAVSGAHSWVVLYHATLGCYVCIDLLGADVAHGIKMYFSKLPFTGGSTTARPTAGDEWPGLASVQVHDNTATLHRIQILYSTLGDFWLLTGKAGEPYHAVCLVRLADAAADDSYPEVTYEYYGTALAMDATYLNQYVNWFGRTGGGALVSNTLYMGIIWCGSNSSQALAGIPGGGDQRRHNWPEHPAWMFITDNAAKGGYKGKLPDCEVGVVAIPTGQTDAVVPTRVMIGGLWMPFTVVPTF